MKTQIFKLVSLFVLIVVAFAIVGCGGQTGPAEGDAILDSGTPTAGSQTRTQTPTPATSPTTLAPIGSGLGSPTPGTTPITTTVTTACEEREKVFQPPIGGYPDLAIEPGDNELWLVDIWWNQPTLQITEKTGEIWPISAPALKGKAPKTKLSMVIDRPIHFKNSMGGYAKTFCVDRIMAANGWTMQQVIESVSNIADTHAAETAKLNAVGTNQEFIWRANLPYAIKDMTALLNCVTPGEYGIPACNAVNAGSMSVLAAGGVPSTSALAAATNTPKPKPTATPVPAKSPTPAPTVRAPTAVPAAVKCDTPIKTTPGNSTFTAEGPEIVALFNGANGKLVTAVQKGQTLTMTTGDYNYSRFLLPDGCASQIEGIAQGDKLFPDGRQYKPASFWGATALSAPAVQVASLNSGGVALVSGDSTTTLAWDPRLNSRFATIYHAAPKKGQTYWKLIQANWLDEKESRTKVNIFVNTLGLDGKQKVASIQVSSYTTGEVFETKDSQPGKDTLLLNDALVPVAYDFPMGSTVAPSYNVTIGGALSDTFKGAGLGDLKRPGMTIHTAYYLVFQETVAR